MKIAFVTDSILPSTQANAVQQLHMAAAFGQLGHDVRIFAPRHAGRAAKQRDLIALRADFALPANVKISYLPFFKLGSRFAGSFFLIAVAAARLWRCDVLFTRTARIGAWAAQMGCSVILESHSMPNSNRTWRSIKKLSSHPNLKRWVFISERLRELYLEKIPRPRSPLCVAHDGVLLQRFAEPEAKNIARDKLKLTVKNRLVVHAGHLYEGRGAEFLVDALAALPGTQLLFVGGRESDIARMQRYAVKNGVEGVQFAGHKAVSEVATYLFAADVLVMAYTSQTTVSDGKTQTIEYASPLKLFEYMAARRPIVSTRFPAIAEVLRHEKNAYLVAPNSSAELAHGIRSVLARADGGAALAEQAYMDVHAYSWEARARRILGP